MDMVKKEADMVSLVDMKEQTPKICIEVDRFNILYEKAFLSRESDSDSEYERNTTTWD